MANCRNTGDPSPRKNVAPGEVTDVFILEQMHSTR